VFAGLIFVTSVISIPMIMDRQVDAISAGLTSIRACLQNPGVMLLWGALITCSWCWPCCRCSWACWWPGR
jgi:uncharacterized membrane protein